MLKNSVLKFVLLVIAAAARIEKSGKEKIKYIKEEYKIYSLPYFKINPTNELDFLYDTAALIVNLDQNDFEYKNKVQAALNGEDPNKLGVRGIAGSGFYCRPDYLNCEMSEIYNIVDLANAKYLNNLKLRG